jgi:hypothetical protein
MTLPNRLILLLLISVLAAPIAQAHNVSAEDIALISGRSGFDFLLYLWLGAKHMVTGYDHILFLLGVIFYLTGMRSVALYVTLFAVGHSLTLIFGVLNGINVNPYFIDGIIGLSVAYKAFDNLGGFDAVLGWTPDDRWATFIFGLFHGLGLATKLQDLGLSEDGLLPNLLSFNVGVELGQIAALSVLLVLLVFWRRADSEQRFGVPFNFVILACGFALASWQFMHMAL